MKLPIIRVASFLLPDAELRVRRNATPRDRHYVQTVATDQRRSPAIPRDLLTALRFPHSPSPRYCLYLFIFVTPLTCGSFWLAEPGNSNSTHPSPLNFRAQWKLFPFFFSHLVFFVGVLLLSQSPSGSWTMIEPLRSLSFPSLIRAPLFSLCFGRGDPYLTSFSLALRAL